VLAAEVPAAGGAVAEAASAETDGQEEQPEHVFPALLVEVASERRWAAVAVEHTAEQVALGVGMLVAKAAVVAVAAESMAVAALVEEGTADMAIEEEAVHASG
jgi:hypothetical protein